MATMIPIKAIECPGCGRQELVDDESDLKPAWDGRIWNIWCVGCDALTAWTLRDLLIAPADLRYAERFNRDPDTDAVGVTGLAE